MMLHFETIAGFHFCDSDLDVKPVDPGFLVEPGEDSVDVDAGHYHLGDQELNVELELEETLL